MVCFVLAEAVAGASATGRPFAETGMLSANSDRNSMLAIPRRFIVREAFMTGIVRMVEPLMPMAAGRLCFLYPNASIENRAG